MLQIATTIMQIIGFLAEHKEDIKKMILDIESLVPDEPGNNKALVVRNFIATSLNIADQIEQAWPYVGFIFNGLVKATKGK